MFSLPTSVNQLQKKEYVNAKYTQVSSSRDATGSNFSNGAIRFSFSQASDEWLSLSKSYIRCRLALSDDAGNVLIDTDNVAPAVNIMSTLFQSLEIQLNGVTVSRCSDFVSAIDTLTKRMGCSAGHMKTVLNDIGVMDHDIEKRFTICENDSVRIDVITTAGVDATSKSDGTDSARKLLDLEFIWSPTCLSLFRDSHALPGGDWTLILHPHPTNTAKSYAIQSTGASKTPGSGNDFDISIRDIYFYAHTMKGPRVENMTYYLGLDEVRCQAESITSVNLTQYNFEVSPSTHQLVFGFQDDRSTDTRTSRSSLKCFASTPSTSGEEEELSRFFFTYAGTKQPAIDLELSGNGATANREWLSQVYYDSLAVTGQLDCASPTETLYDWRGHGMYLAYDTAKDASDRSTRVSVNCQFDSSAYISNMNLLCFDIHKSVAQITVQGGQVRSVLVQDA